MSYIETGIKSYENRLKKAEETTLDLVKKGDYKLAVRALADCIALKAAKEELEFAEEAGVED